MTAATAYPVTMTELRGEPAHLSIWSNYGSSTHSSSRLSGSMDPSFPSPSPTSTSAVHSVRSRGDNGGHSSYAYGRYGAPEDQNTYGRSPQTAALASHHSYPSLKRTFSQAGGAPYQEMVQDLRDDGARLNMGQDHKLLAFRRSQDKHTILDQHGQVQQLELSAQLHGMFFLSEMPANSGDGSSLQPELTCYRRNLFQISGSLITPRGQLSVVNESGETRAISSMEVNISAIESVDGNVVRLIVIPWKTPPPNSPDVSQNPDQEPVALPLIPFQGEGTEPEGDYAVYPVGWRRLQFRIATANNGRRKELQQHFVLHLKVMATLSDGSKMAIAESTTAPIVVRGRSPRNFQARKEIPLLGSSAGSRGQALVETGLGVVAGSLSLKQPDGKGHGVGVPAPSRSAFTFSPPKIPGVQLGPAKSSSYQPWNSPGSVPNTSPSGPYPPGDPYAKLPLASSSHFSTGSPELSGNAPLPSSVPLGIGSHGQPTGALRSQYTYVEPDSSHMRVQPSPVNTPSHSLSVPRYVDEARPAKNARHTGPDGGQDYRYGSYVPPITSSGAPVSSSSYHPEPSSHESTGLRDLYPHNSSWTSNAGDNNPTYALPNGDSRPYPFQSEPYRSGPSGAGAAKTASRASFDDVNNYSWGSN